MAKLLRKPKKKKQAQQIQGSEREAQLLEQLKEVAARLSLEVREERLVREVGYSVHSGRCRLHGREVILLDRNASLAERIDVLVESLSKCDLGDVYMEPELRQLIAGHAAERDSSHDTGSSTIEGVGGG